MLMRIIPQAALALALGGACGASEDPRDAVEVEPEVSLDEARDDEVPTGGEGPIADEAVNEATPGAGITLRLELLHPRMPAGGQPNVDVDARLDARLHVRNTGAAERTIATRTYAAFQLEWRVDGADGSRWDVTFLSPPMPPPGGVPELSFTLAPGEETRVTELHGISGFRAHGAAPSEFVGMLPAGSYTVTLSGFRLATGEALSAPAVPLEVR